MGLIKSFFEVIGIKNLKFKPTFNPYTEPSLEMYGFHPQLKKWMELGNSGIFRPEMLKPMGLPDDVNVIAWGFGLERPTMIHYNLRNIRELFGHKVSLSSTKKNKICYIVPDNSKEPEEKAEVKKTEAPAKGQKGGKKEGAAKEKGAAKGGAKGSDKKVGAKKEGSAKDDAKKEAYKKFQAQKEAAGAAAGAGAGPQGSIQGFLKNNSWE